MRIVNIVEKENALPTKNKCFVRFFHDASRDEGEHYNQVPAKVVQRRVAKESVS